MNSLLERLARSASWFMLFGRGLFFSVVLLLILMRSVITVVRVEGHSMDPTLVSGQWVFVDVLTKQFAPWQFGDMVILRFPGDPIHSWYVKRIIGLPGDRINFENGQVVRNGQIISETYLLPDTTTEPGVINVTGTVPVDQYLVLGDNRQISNDSRFFGYVPKDDLFGKVLN